MVMPLRVRVKDAGEKAAVPHCSAFAARGKERKE